MSQWLLVCLSSLLISAVISVPSGKNVCTNQETYSKSALQSVLEPVTYRSYTWCLKVPPRCSKYTVQLKERFKIKTVIANRTVVECCSGFVELSLKCVPRCPEGQSCPFMNCTQTDPTVCHCLQGYTGLYCSNTCPTGIWGKDCGQECKCTENICNHVSGECILQSQTLTTTVQQESTPQPSHGIKSVGQLLLNKHTTLLPNSYFSQTAPQTVQTHSTPQSIIHWSNLTDVLNDVERKSQLNVLTSVLSTITNSISSASNAVITSQPEVLQSMTLQDSLITVDSSSSNDLKSDLSMNDYSGSDENIDINESEFVESSSLEGGLAKRDIKSIDLLSSISLTIGSAMLLILVAAITVTVIRCKQAHSKEPYGNKATDSRAQSLLVHNINYSMSGLKEATFFCPTFTNHYAVELNREFGAAHYDHPRSLNACQEEPLYAELRY